MASLTKVAAALSIVVGALCLCGWAFDIERLRQPFAGFVAMNPATAASFIIVGVALTLSAESRRGTAASVAARCLGGVILLLGAAKLVGMAADFHPNIDEWLFSGSLSLPGQPPNRMAPNTAVNFVLIGLAILTLDVPLGSTSIGQVFAILAGFGALLPLTGYLYGERSFQGVAAFIPMAPHTAITFLSVSAGLFFGRSRLLLTQVFATRDPRGVLTRRLAPFAVCLTLGLGWLRLAGEQRGLYAAPFGTAAFALILSLLFVLLVAWAAGSVGRADRERQAMNQALAEKTLNLEESLRETQLILDHAREIICTIDPQGQILSINSASEEILSRRPKELIGLEFSSLHSLADRPLVASALREVQTGFRIANLNANCLRKDETLAPIAWSLQASPHYHRIFCVGRER